MNNILFDVWKKYLTRILTRYRVGRSVMRRAVLGCTVSKYKITCYTGVVQGMMGLRFSLFRLSYPTPVDSRRKKKKNMF